jgi:hypothetical protein
MKYGLYKTKRYRQKRTFIFRNFPFNIIKEVNRANNLKNWILEYLKKIYFISKYITANFMKQFKEFEDHESMSTLS